MAHAWKACWVQALGGSNPPSSAVSVSRAMIRFMGNDLFITFKAVLITIPAIVTVIGFSIGVRPWNLRGLVD